MGLVVSVRYAMTNGLDGDAPPVFGGLTKVADISPATNFPKFRQQQKIQILEGKLREKRNLRERKVVFWGRVFAICNWDLRFREPKSKSDSPFQSSRR